MSSLILRTASTASYTSGTSIPVMDGVTLINNELVLLKDQGSATNPTNGIYKYSASTGQLTTATGYTTKESLAGLSVIITRGSTNIQTQWLIQADEYFPAGVDTKVFYAGFVPGYVTSTIPIKLDFTDLNSNADNQIQIQAAINSLLQYGNYADATNSYWESIPTIATAMTISALSQFGVLYMCAPSSGTLAVTLSAGGATDFSIFFALSQPGIVTFAGATTNSIPGHQLSRRFQGAKATWSAGVWTVSNAPVLAGGTVYLPGGNIYINREGIKLHPAVNLVGENVGTTILKAGTNFQGTPDVSGEDYALISVCARAPDVGTPGTKMFNPTIRNLSVLMPTAQGVIDGIYFEKGGVDPYFDPDRYSGSSGQIYDVVVKGFSQHGVFVKPDRQRFYCEALRCIGNDGDGIRIGGNDPVIGPRSGFGSNGGSSVHVSDCSGVIITGANVWESLFRSDANLACRLINMNGAVLSGCKFNDTVSVEVGVGSNSNRNTPTVISGCEFNPNEDVFSAGATVWTPGGLCPDEYDACIRVSGVSNVHIAANTFAATNTNTQDPVKHPYAAYKYLVTVVSDVAFPDAGQAVFTGAIRSGQTGVDAAYSTAPFYTSSGSSGAYSWNAGFISYDLRDVYSGASIAGGLDDSGVPAPDMRGVDASDMQNYPGYVAVDSGPILQLSSPELADGTGVMFFTSASGSSAVNVPASVRYLFVDKSSGGSVTINLQPGTTHIQNDSPITIVFRSMFGTVNWQYNGSTFPWIVPGDAPINPVSPGTSFELMFRGSTAKYYRVWPLM